MKKLKKMILIILGAIAVITFAVMGYLKHPKFGRAAQGARLERMQQSLNYADGAFRNQHPTPQITSGKSRMQTMYEFIFEKREGNRPEQAIPTIKSDLQNLSATVDQMVWFGHSSYLITSSGKRMLVDPVFEDAAPVSFINKPFEGTRIYKAGDMPDIDYLIITHDHWDHLDYHTVTKLRDRIGKVICPLGVGEYFEQWGFDINNIIEMDWNENRTLVDGFTIHCLPSQHFSGRMLKPNLTLWASYMLTTPTQTIYLSGDGGYNDHFKIIAAQFPYIDLAIMENGQYNNDWKFIHLTPPDLLKAIDDLKPKLVFAGHNSKFALAKHPWKEPLENVAKANENSSINFITPMIGEITNLTDTTNHINNWWAEK